MLNSLCASCSAEEKGRLRSPVSSSTDRVLILKEEGVSKPRMIKFQIKVPVLFFQSGSLFSAETPSVTVKSVRSFNGGKMTQQQVLVSPQTNKNIHIVMSLTETDKKGYVR